MEKYAPKINCDFTKYNLFMNQGCFQTNRWNLSLLHYNIYNVAWLGNSLSQTGPRVIHDCTSILTGFLQSTVSFSRTMEHSFHKDMDTISDQSSWSSCDSNTNAGTVLGLFYFSMTAATKWVSALTHFPGLSSSWTNMSDSSFKVHGEHTPVLRWQKL